MGQSCIASYMSAPVLPDAMQCDGLLIQAMRMSSADESMGENTTGVCAWKQFCATQKVSPCRPSIQSSSRPHQPEVIKDTPATRAMLDDKVPIKSLKRATAVQAENSLYNFKGAMKQMELLKVVEGDVEGSVEEEDRLNRAVMRRVGDDECIVSSIRTMLDQKAEGTDIFEHILTYYIEPMVGDSSVRL